MNAHYPLSVLPLGPNHNQPSYALWARKPTGKAVVFLHGYSGDALTTWSEFDKLIPETPEFVGCDFVFYGHDGLFGTTIAGSTLFYEFLDRLFTQTASLTIPNIGNKEIRRRFSFSKVVLAAHSLGAVFCRWALLFARQNNKDWMDKTGMVLYAPAHMGARVADLIDELGRGGTWLSQLLTLFGVAANFASPLITELKEGGLDLQRLLDETNKALAQGDGSYLIAQKIVCAEHERVVKNTRFAQDAWPPVVFAGRDHSGVCKPNSKFLDPLDVLSEVL